MLSCALVAGTAAAGTELDALVDKLAGAYGGRVKLEDSAVVRESGRVEAVRNAGHSIPTVRTYARPLKLRVEIGGASNPGEVRILDGEKGWRNGKESSTGMGYEAMVLQAVRLDLPYQLLSQRKVLAEKESVDLEGKRLRVLELPLTNGLSIAVGVEAETGRILFSRGTTQAGPEGSTTFETRYDDFRTVAGRLFAFKESNFAGGTKTADIFLTKIELLKVPPADAFKP